MIHQRQVINCRLDLKLARWQEYEGGTGGEVRVGRVVRAGDHNRYLLPVTEGRGPACLGKNYLLSNLIFFASWPKYCRSEWWQIWKWGILRGIQSPWLLVGGEQRRNQEFRFRFRQCRYRNFWQEKTGKFVNLWIDFREDIFPVYFYSESESYSLKSIQRITNSLAFSCQKFRYRHCRNRNRNSCFLFRSPPNMFR